MTRADHLPPEERAFRYCGAGVTRHVVLWRSWAFKAPRVNFGWRLFLQGLLANMQERTFGRAGWPTLCPVVWSMPGGWLTIMRRARPLTDAEADGFDFGALISHPDYPAPAEPKPDSFGWIDGRVVAVDYGN